MAIDNSNHGFTAFCLTILIVCLAEGIIHRIAGPGIVMGVVIFVAAIAVMVGILVGLERFTGINALSWNRKRK